MTHDSVAFKLDKQNAARVGADVLQSCITWLFLSPSLGGALHESNGGSLFSNSLNGEGLSLNTNLPNFITLGRVFSVPVLFWLLLSDHPRLAFWLFVAAGISDALDGYIAKHYNMRTELGAYLDPLADKLLIVSVYLALVAQGQMPLWLVIMVVGRDLTIPVAVLLARMLDRPLVMKPLFSSKVTTVALLTYASVVLADLAFMLGLDQVRSIVAAASGLVLAWSMVDYLILWLPHMTTAGTKGDRTWK